MKLLLFVLVFLTGYSLQAQEGIAGKNYWNDISERELDQVPMERRIIPLQYRTLELDVNTIQNVLSQSPTRDLSIQQNSQVLISVPMPDGSFQSFKVFYTPLMPDKLASRYPQIRTYTGFGIDDPTAFMKFDITQFGFHAMIRSAQQGAVFIDPYFYGNDQYYISYYKKDFYKSSKWDCTFDEVNHTHPVEENVDNRFAGDCNFRTYTLALACTGEYAAYHGGSVSSVMAAYNTSMNRVNGVFEQDCSLTMELHPNTDTLIFLNAGTDPYTNGNGSTMLGQNITTCNARIGSANYDIGHVFSTGGGGVAYLGAVCGSNKAGGVTGSNMPIGDAYDIDYVAHEMGHQFGGNHTQNNDCNRNNSTAMEPGSASTIMGYAGICDPDVQPHSDAYYHAISLQEIGNFTTGSGNSCATTINPPNNAPTANAGSDYTVPRSTPLVLTGSATNPEGMTGLTYCWEQMNSTAATMPPVSTNTAGPAFRSLTPVTSPSRYLPFLSAVIADTTPTWEVLPSVARTMAWRFTVRDNAEPGGCTANDDMVITVNGTAGPFVVTAPNTAVTWNVGTNQTITWNVAGTTAAPVSCANVKITLSLDGGYTYPVTLVSTTTNDGSETIIVPNNPTTMARVRIESVGNIFYDISNTNFTIVSSNPDFVMDVTPATQEVCSPANAVYTVAVSSILGYNSPVTLATSGLPMGLAAAFSVNPVTPAGNSVLTLSNTGAVTPGTYNIIVTGTGSTGVKNDTVQLTILNGNISNVTLSSPANGATNVAVSPVFSWTGGAGATTYQLDIATNANFSNIVYTSNTITSSPFTLLAPLSSSTTFFWRVRGINNCVNGSYSPTFSFTTIVQSCINYASTNVPVSISASGTPTITSTLAVPATGTILDVNVTNLGITHTWVSDIIVRITSPSGTVVELVNAICNDQDNFSINFDSQSGNAYTSIPCPPTGGGTYQPLQSLNAFNGQTANGTWTLTVLDIANQDGGSLTSWGLTICTAAASNMTVTATSTYVACFNGNDGTITAIAAGGTSPYQYSLNGGGSQPNGSFTGLSAGNYTVVATDAGNNTASVSVVITQPATALTIAASASTSGCGTSATGSILLNSTGGVAPYTYLWNDGNTNQSRTGLAAGTYTATVTDDNGCTVSISQTITLPAPLTVNLGANITICKGECTTLNAAVTGGTTPYTYLWNNGVTTATQTVCPNKTTTYKVTVTDNNGCTTNKTVKVIITTVAATVTANQTICPCSTANLTATGGGTYSWSTGEMTPGITVSPAATTTYVVTVTNTAGCTTSLSSKVTLSCSPPSGLTAAFVNSNVVFSWAPSCQTNAYKFYWRCAGTSAWILVNLPGTTTSYSLPLPGCSSVEWQLRGQCCNGSWSAFATGPTANQGFTDGEAENRVTSQGNLPGIVNAQTLILKPNPVIDDLEIVTDNFDGEAQLTITDMTGRLMQKVELNSAAGLTLDISSYPAGMYMVTAVMGEVQLSEKFIKL